MKSMSKMFTKQGGNNNRDNAQGDGTGASTPGSKWRLISGAGAGTGSSATLGGDSSGSAASGGVTEGAAEVKPFSDFAKEL